MTDLLEVRGLTVVLPTAAGWVRPVNEVSRRIGAGESLGLVGESGSGKTDDGAGIDGFAAPHPDGSSFHRQLSVDAHYGSRFASKKKGKAPENCSGAFPTTGMLNRC